MKKLLALCLIFSLSVPGNAQKQTGAKDSIKVFYDGLFSVLKKANLMLDGNVLEAVRFFEGK